VGRLQADGTVVATSHGAVLVVAGTATPTEVSDEAFRVIDIGRLEAGRESYDVVYARFLLSRLPCRAQAAAWMAGHLAPRGVLVVEDVQPDPGSSLAALLRAAGLEDVDVEMDPLPRTVQAWGRAPA
jgi:hypothetical protein